MITNEKAIIKIKLLIDNYFEDVGREAIEDIDETRQDLIMDIDALLDKTKLNRKELILEKLKDKEKDGKYT